VAPGGLLVLNSSLIEAEPSRADIEVLNVPCSALAREVGDERVISIVALAAAMARRPIVSPASVRRAVVALARKGGPELVERNLRALEAGDAHGLVQATVTTRA
jgi:2-oxoglutarate ferredoxin oxidoreductase subunit gamma